MIHPRTHHAPMPQAIPAHELPEYTAYVSAIYINGDPAHGSPDDPGFTVPAMASEFSYDVIVNIAGGGGTKFGKAASSGPAPTKYKVQVRFGERVFVQRTGRLLEFLIPHIPYVKPCPSSAAQNAASRFRRKGLPGLGVIPPSEPGGGTPIGGTGSAGTGPGSGGLGGSGASTGGTVGH